MKKINPLLIASAGFLSLTFSGLVATEADFTGKVLAERGGGGGHAGGHAEGHSGSSHAEGSHMNSHRDAGRYDQGEHHEYNHDGADHRNVNNFNQNSFDHHDFNRNAWDHNNFNGGWGGDVYVPQGEYVYPGAVPSSSTDSMDPLYNYDSQNPNSGG